jgi:hypothetical protein
MHQVTHLYLLQAGQLKTPIGGIQTWREGGLMPNCHKRPIGAHFHLGGAKFSYLGQDLEEALGEPEETVARMTVWETAAEHLHDVLSGD